MVVGSRAPLSSLNKNVLREVHKLADAVLDSADDISQPTCRPRRLTVLYRRAAAADEVWSPQWLTEHSRAFLCMLAKRSHSHLLEQFSTWRARMRSNTGCTSAASEDFWPTLSFRDCGRGYSTPTATSRNSGWSLCQEGSVGRSARVKLVCGGSSAERAPGWLLRKRGRREQSQRHTFAASGGR